MMYVSRPCLGQSEAGVVAVPSICGMPGLMWGRVVASSYRLGPRSGVPFPTHAPCPSRKILPGDGVSETLVMVQNANPEAATSKKEKSPLFCDSRVPQSPALH